MRKWQNGTMLNNLIRHEQVFIDLLLFGTFLSCTSIWWMWLEREQSSEKFSRFTQKHYKAIIMRKLTNDPRVLSHLEHHQSTKDTCLMDRKRGPRVPDLMMFTMQGLAFFLFLLQLLWSAPIIVENIFCHGFDRFPDTCQILRYRSCD